MSTAPNLECDSKICSTEQLLLFSLTIARSSQYQKLYPNPSVSSSPSSARRSAGFPHQQGRDACDFSTPSFSSMRRPHDSLMACLVSARLRGRRDLSADGMQKDSRISNEQSKSSSLRMLSLDPHYSVRVVRLTCRTISDTKA